MRRLRAYLPLLLLLCLGLQAFGQDLASFEKRVTVKKLANGLTIVLCRRTESPTFSFFTIVDAGSAQDPKGETGIAHMMEHMAFKGTYDIGTTNYPAEKIALAKVETAYATYRNERLKVIGRDEAKVAAAKKAWEEARTAADKYAVKNAYGKIVEEEGGVGMNASTSYDSTQYFYSMPINRFQLWAYLESDRMMHPVMREFYKERDVVTEERRMRVDSSPMGRALEQFTSVAFDSNPYHRPTVGYPGDLRYFSATQALQFFDKYYVPSNMVIAVVGDLDPATALPIMEKYFGRIPGKPKPDEYSTPELPQNSEREVLLKEPMQPIYIEGYHRPDYLDPDDAVYTVIADLMSDGRTSRLYRSLVEKKKIAAYAAGFSGFPGSKYANMFAFYGVPLPGHTDQEIADAIHEEIDKVKTQDVSDAELKMIKTRERASLIRSLDSNAGLAQNLAVMELRYGNWQELFNQLNAIDKVTKADIRRVANKVFVSTNRTVGYIENSNAATKGAK